VGVKGNIDMHEVRNRLTAADLMLTAMIDGKQSPSLPNLTMLAATLAELKTLIAVCVTTPLPGIFDINEIVETAAQRLALLAEAFDVRLECVQLRTDDVAGRLATGQLGTIRKAFEDVLAFLIRAFPAHGTLVIAPASPARLILRGRDAAGEPVDFGSFLPSASGIAGGIIRLDLHDKVTCYADLSATPVATSETHSKSL
jgi:hypothetical protein